MRPWRHYLHPMIAICVIQAALSLTLVWSNTAFGDEAEYLWAGRLEWLHWLHGRPVPRYFPLFSGSPIVYPPVGALANSIGGLAGARILSLGFMLGATILLYLTAARLIGRTGAIIAAALWAVSESAIRLAFATFDPLSVLLTALSAWLIVQAGYRRHRNWFIAAAAAALAVANVSAYSGIVIDPVVIAFAFLVWLPRIGVRQASCGMAWLSGGLILIFSILMALSRSWSGLMSTVISRKISDHQSLLLALNNIWAYSGFIIILAIIGAVYASSVENPCNATLVVLLSCAVFVVPAAQLYNQTAWSLDKHLAYGIWFAVIAAGYGCSRFIRWLPGVRSRLAVACCIIALIYPTLASWKSAWTVYHGWADARSFITAFTPVVAESHGFIYTSGQNRIAEYYTSQGRDWARWNDAISLDPVAVRPSEWHSYYTTQLHNGNYGAIALFYTTTFAPTRLPANILLTPETNRTYEDLLAVFGKNSGKPGLSALTQVLEKDSQYHLVAVGPYDSTTAHSIYVIWEKQTQKQKHSRK